MATTVKLYLCTHRGPRLCAQHRFEDHAAACRFESERGQELADAHGLTVSGALHRRDQLSSNGGYYRPRSIPT